MTNKDLADLIFPNIDKDIEYYENLYPKRNINEDCLVTRFAPSPTGFMHIGNFMSAIIDYIIAYSSNGVFYLRNEDTDQKREVEGAVESIFKILKYYNIMPSEYEFNNEIIGNYGPYIQSERKEIYQAFIKKLIIEGKCYPCFCSKEELDELREMQEHKKERTGYYGKYRRCNNLTVEEQIKKIKNNESYVLRFRSTGDFEQKFSFHDEVKGDLELPYNDLDVPLMKSDNFLPTYHLAHVIDDHLMRTTHVVRGEEWLSSAPIHVELFDAFGFSLPHYVHMPLILKKDESGNIRKISKRKDPEASMSYYEEKGYPVAAVIESLMTIINTNYEQWHTDNPDKLFTDFKFNPSKMSSSGSLYDLEKLNNISKTIISKMTKEEVYENLLNWTSIYDTEFNNLLTKYKDYSLNIFSIERYQEKPRKDYICYSMIKSCIWYMFDELYTVESYEWKNISDLSEIKNILKAYMDKYYDVSSKEEWFNKIKLMCDKLGYASNMKEYKENPSKFKGNVADISNVLRVGITSVSTTPDLYEIMKLLGKDRIINRIEMIK